MPDATELTKSIKKAAVQAVRAEKPADVCFGKVIATAPLQILVEQKMTLGKAQIVLCRHLTDHRVRLAAEDGPDRAAHAATAEQTEVTVQNGLATGDQVVLLRRHGGQVYVVLDRIG